MAALLTLSFRAEAFSLLGPPEPWMDHAKGYQRPGDIGGPMNIGQGYRWNIPVITYGFDQSFTDYFGSNGVAAVEAAISVLNALPPASSINLSNYPVRPWTVNPSAASNHLVDVKTMALPLLLEQMGLTDATRWLFTLRDFSLQPDGTNYSFSVIQRSFDPTNATPSPFLNGVPYSYFIQPISTNEFVSFVYAVDPIAVSARPATAIGSSFYGNFLKGLSPDDVGGLRYLLSENNVAFENLLPDVHTQGTNDNELVRGAYRPGVEKLTFVRFPDSQLGGQFGIFTNRWTDSFHESDSVFYQEVERVTTQPDIVFSAADLGAIPIERTGTTNWENNAFANGNPSGGGPGIIRPPIKITFGRSQTFTWASFDGSTNAPITYPRTFPATKVRLDLVVEQATNKLQWTLAGAANGRFNFQTSTNLSNWTTILQLTNSGAPFDFSYTAPIGESQRFFRTVQTN